MGFLIALFFGWEKVTCIKCKNNSVRMIVNDGLSKTSDRAPPYWTVWVDEPSPFVVNFWSGELHKVFFFLLKQLLLLLLLLLLLFILLLLLLLLILLLLLSFQPSSFATEAALRLEDLFRELMKARFPNFHEIFPSSCSTP